MSCICPDGGSENTVIGHEEELAELAQHVIAQVDILPSLQLDGAAR